MRDLLDPSQPFYQKHGFPKVEPIKTAAQTSQPSNSFVDENFRNTLIAQSSCIDCLNYSGVWEVVVIEELSTFLTEIRFNWSTGTVVISK